MSRLVLVAAALLALACHHGVAAPATVVTVALAAPERDVEAIDRVMLPPLEDALRGAPGLSHVDAVAFAGGATLRVSFASGAKAAETVRDRLAHINGLSIEPSGHIVHYSLRTDVLTMTQLRGLATGPLRAALARTPGVLDVAVCGGGDPELEVWPELEALADFQLALADVVTALQATPAVRSLDDLKSLVVATRNGAAVRLDEVASLSDGGAPPDCWVTGNDGVPCIEVSVTLADGVTPPAVGVLERELPMGARLEEEAEPALVLSLAVTPDERVRVQRAVGIGGDRPPAGAAPDTAGQISARLDRARPDELELRFPSTPAPDLQVRTLNDQTVGAGLGAVRDRANEVRLLLVTSADLDVLRATARALATASLPGVAASGVSGATLVPSPDLTVDATAVKALGVSQAAIDQAVALSRHGLVVGHLQPGVPIVVRIKALDATTLLAKDGSAVKLSQVAAVKIAAAPLTILRHDGQHAVEVWLRLAPGSDREALRKSLAAALKLPPGVVLEWEE